MRNCEGGCPELQSNLAGLPRQERTGRDKNPDAANLEIVSDKSMVLLSDPGIWRRCVALRTQRNAGACERRLHWSLRGPDVDVGNPKKVDVLIGHAREIVWRQVIGRHHGTRKYRCSGFESAAGGQSTA